MLEQRRCLDEVLEVVEHQEHRPVADELLEGLGERGRRRLADPERLRDRGNDELRVADGFERHDEDAVGVVLDDLRRRLQRESRLAGARRAGQRQQPHVLAAEQVRDRRELALAADQQRRLHREVRRPALERAQRREGLPEPVFDELVEPYRPAEVLQPVLAQVTDGVLVADEVAGGLGEQHLTAVPGSADPCGPRHVEPDVSRLSDPRLTRVEADAHLEPVLGALDLHSRCDRVRRPRERGEERLALRVDLAPVVPFERGADDPVVLRERRVVVVAELLEQARRSFDIGEEERHGARRKRGHRRELFHAPAEAW